jgi:hypothetical protein
MIELTGNISFGIITLFSAVLLCTLLADVVRSSAMQNITKLIQFNKHRAIKQQETLRRDGMHCRDMQQAKVLALKLLSAAWRLNW